MTRLILPFVAGIALAACSAVKPGSTTSAADVDPLRRAVVEDIAELMEREFDPLVTVLRPATSEGALQVALTANLRARGFRVDPSYPGARSFSCEAIPVAAGQYLVRVTVGGVRLSRLWVIDGHRAYDGGAWARVE